MEIFLDLGSVYLLDAPTFIVYGSQRFYIRIKKDCHEEQMAVVKSLVFTSKSYPINSELFLTMYLVEKTPFWGCQEQNYLTPQVSSLTYFYIKLTSSLEEYCEASLLLTLSSFHQDVCAILDFPSERNVVRHPS